MRLHVRGGWSVTAFATCLVLLGAVPALAGQEDPDLDTMRLNLPKDEANVAMLAGQLGLADFCVAYGVDFRERSGRIRDKLGSAPYLQDNPSRFLTFSRMYELGRRAVLYSVKEDVVLDMVAGGADMKRVCAEAFRGTMAFDRLK